MLNALNWIYDLQLDQRQYLVINQLKKAKNFIEENLYNFFVQIQNIENCAKSQIPAFYI